MALYRKGAGEPILYIGGAALAHNSNCCCSACSDAVTILCCLRGQSYSMGECECEKAGGFVVAEGSNCDGSGGDGDGGNGSCSSTMVDCCYYGESLSLTACDCAIIGGVANPGTCTPIVVDGGCLMTREIRIRSRTAPYQWPCLSRMDGTGCGGARPTCSSPDGSSMCFGCCSAIGDCTVCADASIDCGITGTESYYHFTLEDNAIDTGPPGVTMLEDTAMVCSDPCCDGPNVQYFWRETIIVQNHIVCPGDILRNIETEIQAYAGTGCGCMDTTNLYQYDGTNPNLCVTPCD